MPVFIATLACTAYKGFCDGVGRANAPEIDFLIKFGPSTVMSIIGAYHFRAVSRIRGSIELTEQNPRKRKKQSNLIERVEGTKEFFEYLRLGEKTTTLIGGALGAASGALSTSIGYGVGYAAGKLVERLS